MRQKLIELTEANYYTRENEYISNSKVSDFLASKEYYKAKHIDHTVIEEKTDAMELGSMVDHIFSRGSIGALTEKYRVKQGRSDVHDPEDPIIPVTLTQWNKAIEMGRTILDSEWYLFYKTPGLKVNFQQILTDKVKTKKPFIGICGKTDIFVIDEANKTIYIDDVKTAALGAMRTSTTWYWHCLEFGYFRQLYGYRLMAQHMFPGFKVITRHAVISSGKRGKYLTKLFVIPEDLLWTAGTEFLNTVTAIANEKTWKDEPVGWSSAETLKRPVSARSLDQMTGE